MRSSTRSNQQHTAILQLPHLITKPDDVTCHFVEGLDPTFITTKSVQAPVTFGRRLEKSPNFQFQVQPGEPAPDFKLPASTGGEALRPCVEALRLLR